MCMAPTQKETLEASPTLGKRLQLPPWQRGRMLGSKARAVKLSLPVGATAVIDEWLVQEGSVVAEGKVLLRYTINGAINKVRDGVRWCLSLLSVSLCWQHLAVRMACLVWNAACDLRKSRATLCTLLMHMIHEHKHILNCAQLESSTTGLVGKIVRKAGQEVRAGEPVCSIKSCPHDESFNGVCASVSL